MELYNVMCLVAIEGNIISKIVVKQGIYITMQYYITN